MKKCFLFLIPVLVLAGIVDDFKLKKYKKICKWENIKTYSDNEKILSIIGVSCVRSDRIYVLPSVINRLKKLKSSRLNALYFSTLYMQQKLIYSFLCGDINLKDFSFPKTDYIFSVLFEKLKKGDFSQKGKKYSIKIGLNEFILYIKNDKMVIDEYLNRKLIKRHIYK